MYTVTDFKTKKALKEAVAKGEKVRVYQPNADIFGKDPYALVTGTKSLEGPHYPKPPTWYATAEVVEGVVVKVK